MVYQTSSEEKLKRIIEDLNIFDRSTVLHFAKALPSGWILCKTSYHGGGMQELTAVNPKTKETTCIQELSIYCEGYGEYQNYVNSIELLSINNSGVITYKFSTKHSGFETKKVIDPGLINPLIEFNTKQSREILTEEEKLRSSINVQIAKARSHQVKAANLQKELDKFEKNNQFH